MLLLGIVKKSCVRKTKYHLANRNLFMIQRISFVNHANDFAVRINSINVFTFLEIP